MHFLPVICLLLLCGTSEVQEATWNIKYENAGKKAILAGGVTSESPSVDRWKSSASEVSNANSAQEIYMAIYTDGSVECPPEEGTFYISGFCTTYIDCANGYPDFFQCTNGMHYNVEEHKCDLPIRAGCELECPENSGNFGIPGKCDRYLDCNEDTVQEKRCPENLHFSPLRRSCVPPTKANCKFTCPKDYGFYPLLGYCDIYVKCQDGEAKYQRCPSGLRFNNNIKTCDIPERATCAENCPKPDGVFPVEGESSAFVNCTNNVPKVNFCDDGYNFNFTTSQCVPPEVNEPARKCPSPNGRFRIPGNWTDLFIECINDNLSIKRCPPNLHLNLETENCE